MDIAIGMDVDGPVEKAIERATQLRSLGFTRMWSSQIFGPDTLTVLAIVGRELRDLDLGTAVVPIHTRHPTMLAAQARTVQDAIGGRLSLGIGLSHKAVVEGMWGFSFDRPAHYMREYLDALAPMLRGETVASKGERVSATTMGTIGPRDVRAPSLLVAALAPKMLEMAGTVTDGTLTWMTGVKTIGDHVVPTINAAAAAAGRPKPRVVCSLPISVTGRRRPRRCGTLRNPRPSARTVARTRPSRCHRVLSGVSRRRSRPRCNVRRAPGVLVDELIQIE